MVSKNRKNRNTGDVFEQETDYVFIGAGGGAIPLLQKTGIPESKHLGGFPISGQFSLHVQTQKSSKPNTMPKCMVKNHLAHHQ
ncbi:malate:quinone oxidoreductase [Staphylococcus warneri]|uniref:malate:quinone oxidoreductase n=1 Tax=Staphylococcus warneri TaxID=1292 RepID=UPI003364CFCE